MVMGNTRYLSSCILSALLLLLLSCQGPDSPLPRSNQVLFVHPSVAFAGHNPVWTPRSDITDRALHAVWKALGEMAHDSQVAEIDQLQAHRVYRQFSEYRVQMTGVIKKGQKFILLNFFPAAMDYPDWQTNLVSVPERGELYWTAEYNVSRHKVSLISFY